MASPHSSGEHASYYVPEKSIWPIVASVALFITALGAANTIQQHTGVVSTNTGSYGAWLLAAGLAMLLFMIVGWFKDTIHESLAGMNSAQLGVSYRMGMAWFIFSEVMFFAAFFGVLFYTRLLTIPWLSGEGHTPMTHELLWPEFQAMWPLVKTPDGRELQAMGPWPLPLINNLILLTSGIFLTIAHHAIKLGQRNKVLINLGVCILLAFSFMFVQAYEYEHAYHLGLKLNAGIYGSIFYMLTGFHFLHVTVGAILLTVMWFRTAKNHFTPENHFAFEAAAWYWHFVDVVWIFLFFVVYWL